MKHLSTFGERAFRFYTSLELRNKLPRGVVAMNPFLIRSIESQLGFGARRDAAIVLGTGKIRQVFEDLNRECSFFKAVHVLEHPRFIMQYRRRKLRDYLRKYCEVFRQVLKE